MVEANSLHSDLWDGRVIGYKRASEECVSGARYLGMPIVWLTYTNSPGFVMRLSVDVCIPGTGGQASTLFPCLFQQCNVLQFLLKSTANGEVIDRLFTSSEARFPILMQGRRERFRSPELDCYSLPAGLF